jgi:hypothetical protein
LRIACQGVCSVTAALFPYECGIFSEILRRMAKAAIGRGLCGLTDDAALLGGHFFEVTVAKLAVPELALAG